MRRRFGRSAVAGHDRDDDARVARRGIGLVWRVATVEVSLIDSSSVPVVPIS